MNNRIHEFCVKIGITNCLLYYRNAKQIDINLCLRNIRNRWKLSMWRTATSYWHLDSLFCWDLKHIIKWYLANADFFFLLELIFDILQIWMGAKLSVGVIYMKFWALNWQRNMVIVPKVKFLCLDTISTLYQFISQLNQVLIS